MQSLSFRAPGRTLTLIELLARAQPGAPLDALRTAVGQGRVRVEGRICRAQTQPCPAGVRIDADLPAPPDPTRVAVPILAQGPDWTAVDKPAGWPSQASRPGGPEARQLVAATLSLPIEQVIPVHRLDAAVSGVWLVAHDAAAAGRLGRAFEERAVHKTYRALAPAPPWDRGRLEAPIDGKQAVTELAVASRRGPVCELELHPVTGRTHQLRRHLAGIGSAILGDTLYGGVLVEGGLRLRAVGLVIETLQVEVDISCAEDTWPVEAVYDPAEVVRLEVSNATIGALERGHPWILTDTETTDPGRFEPGRLVAVRGVGGQDGGWARIEGPGRVAARRWARPQPLAKTGSAGQRARAALARREGLYSAAAEGRTNALRLVHGEADGLPGLAVDCFGDALRLLVTSRAAEPLREEVVAECAEWLAARSGTAPEVVEVVHLRDRPAGALECVRRWPGSPVRSDGRLVVAERGLQFHVDLGLTDPTRPKPGVGLFCDQRENRARLAGLARGAWLNLFAHTGAFSVALLAAGAESVTSVDLSRPYLDVLDANLTLNGLDATRHKSVRAEARRFLERAGERFRGIVLDPPTAAASGRRFWSVRQDGAALIALALGRLEPGGHLLLCRNDARARGTLEPLLRAVAADARVPLRSLELAPPGPDFPRLSGFPEGDAFEAVLAQRG